MEEHSMPAPKMNPYQQEHCDCVNRVLESTPNVQELLECLERCGIKVDELKDRNGSNRQMAEALKREFFPDRA
jgi:hypothetical protein